MKALAMQHDEKSRPSCMNCGSEALLIFEPFLPYPVAHAGSGTLVLCRSCDLLRMNLNESEPLEDPKMLNIWMSEDLRGRIDEVLQSDKGPNTWASLSRYVVDKCVAHSSVYGDLGSYQDDTVSTRVNFWMPAAKKARLEAFAAELGISVAASIRGLFLMFLENMGRLTKGEDSEL